MPEEYKPLWTQYDINPIYNTHNKGFTREYFGYFYARKAKIKEGNIYEMPLADASVDLIAGLCSWDCLGNFQRAAEEVQRCLRPGGLFIHFQDVLPADAPLLVAEAKKRKERGQNAVFPIEITSFQYSPMAGLYVNAEKVTGLASIEEKNKIIRTGRYLIQHLGKICREKGFYVIECDEVFQEVIQRRAEHEEPYRRFRLPYPHEHNDFEWRRENRWNPEIGDEVVRVASRIDVLVAQKQ